MLESVGAAAKNREEEAEVIFGFGGGAGGLQGLVEKGEGFFFVAGAEESFGLIGESCVWPRANETSIVAVSGVKKGTRLLPAQR